MARYLVLKDRDTTSDDDVTFIRDGFHAFAFVLPVIWLLWNRMWLQAALMFGFTGMTAAALHQFDPLAAPAITGIVNFALGLLTALEGPAWLVSGRERQGARVEAVVIARNLREAEVLHAAGLPVDSMPLRANSRSFQPVSQTSLIPLTGA